MTDSTDVRTEPTSPPGLRHVAPWPERLRVPVVFALSALGGVGWGWYLRGDHELPWLGWVIGLPWLILSVDPRLRGKGRLFMMLAWLHVGAMIGVDFIAPKGLIGWVVAVPFYWGFTVPLFFLIRWIMDRWPRFPLVLAWPIVFTGVEWMHARFCPGELSLPVIAHPQALIPQLIQIADFSGTSGLSFVLSSVTGLLGAIILCKLTHPEGARKSLLAQAAFVAVLVGFTLAYGAWQDDADRLVEGPRALIVQTMTPRSAHDPSVARHVYEIQVLQTLSAAAEDVDLVVWPENSVLVPFFQEQGARGWDAYRLQDLRAMSARMGAPLLFGTSWTREQGGSHSLAVLLAGDDEPQVYKKVRLLPWAEYLPMSGLAELIGQTEAWRSFVAGRVGYVPSGVPAPIEDLNPLQFTDRSGKTYSFGTPLCFEAASARVVRHWQRFEVDFLVNQTSEGSLGDSIHERTLSMCRFRAVENRLSVVRCGNDGISALIDPNGQVRQRLRGRYTGATINEAGAAVVTVLLDPTRKGTLYGRFGDWLPIGCLLFAVGAGLVGKWGIRSKTAASA